MGKNSTTLSSASVLASTAVIITLVSVVAFTADATFSFVKGLSSLAKKGFVKRLAVTSSYEI